MKNDMKLISHERTKFPGKKLERIMQKKLF